MQAPHRENGARDQNHLAYSGLHCVGFGTRRAPRAGYLRRTATVIVPLAVWLPLVAKAAPTYEGVGLASCGEWLRERGTSPSTHAGNWVLGFISGFAAANVENHFDPLANTDAPGVWAWMDQYCWFHRTNRIIEAAVAFVETQVPDVAAPGKPPNEGAPPHPH
jgi:hypothetical protein